MAHEQSKGSSPAKRGISRRAFFDRVSDGLYGTALATLLSRDLAGLLFEDLERAVRYLEKHPTSKSASRQSAGGYHHN